MTGRYRLKPVEVEAVQFTGEPSCAEVFAFLGLPHSDDETNHSVIFLENASEDVAEIGDWIVRYPDGEIRAMNAEDFAARFEAAS